MAAVQWMRDARRIKEVLMRTRLRTFICLLTVVVAGSTASALLMNPILQSSPDGFTGNVTEQETSCSYDKNSWAPSMMPPPGCQASS